jgi:NAD(P)-dependent dehydrogenase (short-subunit alcohol dehydrogenase family)
MFEVSSRDAEWSPERCRPMNLGDDDVSPGGDSFLIREWDGIEEFERPSGDDRVDDPVRSGGIAIETGESLSAHRVPSEHLGEHSSLGRPTIFDPGFLKHHDIGVDQLHVRSDGFFSLLPIADPALQVPCHHQHSPRLVHEKVSCAVRSEMREIFPDPRRSMSAEKPSNVPPIENWNRLLDGRIAVVTGGGGGIGRAISELFAQHGAHVELIDIDAESAREAESAILGFGGSARSHVGDVTDFAAVEAFAGRVLAEHSTINVLVNNVGDYRPLARFRESSPASWKSMYDINLFHMFAVTRVFLDAMIEGGGGSIVNVHSVEGMRGYPGDPVYGAMKAAAAAFTTDLAVGMGRHGVRVNGIGPDLTQTAQVDYIGTSIGYEQLWESWAPVGRLGWPEDQARVALFLASDLSAFVSGHNIPVDGGTRAGGGWFWSPSERRFVNRPKGL